MKKQIVIGLFTALAATGTACNKCPEQTATAAKEQTTDITKKSLKSNSDKLNYAVAFDMGKSLTRNGLEYNKNIFNKGLIDGMADTKEALLDENERMETKREHSKIQREKEQKKREEEAKSNLETAKKFLAENKTKEGITTTESGLQYQIIKEGTGEKPTVEDTVTVHYKGTLLDGTEFDSSYKRKKPATFPVGRVVKGWTEALQLMPAGSKWKVFLPPDLAYGERGAGGKIAPNSALIFEIELIEIVKKDEKDTAPSSPDTKKIKSAKTAKPAATITKKTAAANTKKTLIQKKLIKTS